MDPGRGGTRPGRRTLWKEGFRSGTTGMNTKSLGTESLQNDRGNRFMRVGRGRDSS